MEDKVKKQRKLLENNLDKINSLISERLEIKTNFQIEEDEDYRGKIHFKLIDKTNIREACGVMQHAFTNVYMYTFNIFWGKDITASVLNFNFYYEHINGGTNSARFCTVFIQDGGAVTIEDQ